MANAELQFSILYTLLALGFGVAALLWIWLRKQRRLTAEMLHELGVTYEGQYTEWQTRQRDMERITSELLVARDQQDSLLGRNLSNRSMRKEALSLLRVGIQPDSVSAKLDLPRSDVRLLAKVQSILTTSLPAV